MVLTEYNLLDKPDRSFNIGETGKQLNKKPGKIIATKGKRGVHSVTSSEKEENMTIICCCDSTGNFLPSVVSKKADCKEGFPAGLKIFINKKSAYVNTDLFYK